MQYCSNIRQSMKFWTSMFVLNWYAVKSQRSLGVQVKKFVVRWPAESGCWVVILVGARGS